MAHAAQHNFFSKVKEKFPNSFKNVKVIDCGSLDVNGTLKDLFENSEYIGVDIATGKNVDIVSPIKDLKYKEEFDTVISGEMLEHDESWKESLKKMYEMTKPGGLIAFSAAGEGRREHGTLRTSGRQKIWGTSPEYYMNIEEKHVKEAYKPKMFTEMEIEYNPKDFDIYFYGVKSVV